MHHHDADPAVDGVEHRTENSQNTGGEILDHRKGCYEPVADFLNEVDDLVVVGLHPLAEFIERAADLLHRRIAERLEDQLGLVLQCIELVLQ